MTDDSSIERIRKAQTVEELYRALERDDLPELTDFELVFGMTPEEMKAQSPEAYCSASTMGLATTLEDSKSRRQEGVRRDRPQKRST